MAETTKIAWADASLNFWIGCTKVSPACDFCYAEAMAKAYGWAKWGPHEARQFCKGMEAKARKIEREYPTGRPFVFVNSLSDFFDKAVPAVVRRAAFDVMRAHPRLIFLLLTKRPQNILKHVTAAGGLPPNCALGTTVEDNKRLNLNAPALIDAANALAGAGQRALFTFLSCEPLLEWIDVTPYLSIGSRWGIDWVIGGGESGGKARPCPPTAAFALASQCEQFRIPFLWKQWGEHAPPERGDPENFSPNRTVRVGKKKAGRMLGGRTYDARPVVA